MTSETTSDVASTVPGWTPVCMLPNVTLEEPIQASLAAFMPCHDKRLHELARQRPALQTFVSAFRDEFETQILPTIGLVREDARHIANTIAFGGFRDAVCVSTIVAGQGLTLKTKRDDPSQNPIGIVHSDAFDLYPWFLSPQVDDHVVAITPALRELRSLERLRPQSAPALGNRSLVTNYIDHPLLGAILARWERFFANRNESLDDRRLFRALEMARAASKTPGGIDATEYDAGRVVALWVSAFEILAYDGRKSDVKRVLSVLSWVRWLTPKPKGEAVQAIASKIYKRLYAARSKFLHGNPVTAETLTLENTRKHAHWFAAPLFRLALTGFLDLRFSETLPDRADDQERERHVARRKEFDRHQELSEEAILIAEGA